MTTLLWITIPYVAIVIFIGGHIWRYHYDKFGWTTRSSQLYENRLLRLGSPLFHYGILPVILGHIGGILIPESATSAIGASYFDYVRSRHERRSTRATSTASLAYRRKLARERGRSSTSADQHRGVMGDAPGWSAPHRCPNASFAGTRGGPGSMIRSCRRTRMQRSRPALNWSLKGYPDWVARHKLSVDPLDHPPLRRLVSASFSSRRVEALRPCVQGIVDDLLDEVADQGPRRPPRGIRLSP
jgi:nitrate reductase gamma subunit